MRNIINMRTSFFVAASFAALIAGGISVAQAAPAAVTRVDGCGLFDGNGGIVDPTGAKITATQSANGNAMLQCKADVTPAASGGAAHFDYDSTQLSCGVPDSKGVVHMTQHWEEIVSASGEATMTCHLP
jgi:hypothetical protein